MSEKPQRRFWQIHLSTAIMLMILTGFFIWLNIVPKMRQPYMLLIESFGFPFTYYEIVDSSLLHNFHHEPVLASDPTWNFLNLAFDLAVYLTALLTAGILVKICFHRRQARN